VTAPLAILALLLAATALAEKPGAAASAPVAIAVAYNEVIDEAGFNRSVAAGVHSFETQRGVHVRAISHPLGGILSAAEMDAAVIAAIGAGVRAIIIPGTAYASVIARLSKRFPDVRFVSIDNAHAFSGNVRTVQFRSQEAAYLAGIAAARASKSATIGFVGGQDSPGIRAFGCAYAQGALAARKDIRVRGRMLGATPYAFIDTEGGRRAARELLDQGADVIFAAAGASGLGVLDEVAQTDAFAIGVDVNQNGVHPGKVLTSVLKRMDVSVYSNLSALLDGTWQPGLQSVGLAEGAVGLAIDEHNRNLMGRETQAELSAAEFAIQSGELEVIDAAVDATPCAALIRYDTATPASRLPAPLP
jgi:basic membrane protein A